jgi:hypothetical protein
VSSSFGQHKGEAFVSLPAPKPGIIDHYQRDAFEAGLSVAGYSIRRSPAAPPREGDVLVLWNRYDRSEPLARSYERAGGVVLVTENAWLGPDKAGHYFALCRGHHNGAGEWYVGQHPRSHVLDIEFKPWRSSGEHIVILPQRGMGERGVRMEKDWPGDVERRLRKITSRPIVVREHPGPRSTWDASSVAFPEFVNAWAAVTWASGSGIKAIVAGIPVFYEFPKWIGGEAARFGITDKAGASLIESPYLGPRGTMLRKLSWAMWTAEEIASGEPFKCLLS